jgi:hypothetical protein
VQNQESEERKAAKVPKWVVELLIIIIIIINLIGEHKGREINKRSILLPQPSGN